jgi:predicted Rossmann fold flavoprotein
METLAIIGAGPAGIMAALQAAAGGVKPLLIEANSAIGRKLLVTGAGRCNITNLNANPGRYTCSDPGFLKVLFDRVGPPQLREYLAGLGILTYATADGWCYPLSESAQNVVALLSEALQRVEVKPVLNTRISRIARATDGFSLQAEDGRSWSANRLIVAAGGKAQPRLGATGNLFKELQRLGHGVVPIRPALAPLLVDMKPYKALAGVRLDVTASLTHDGTPLVRTKGNLIFTAWGLNGPAVMDLSHLVHGGERLELDLLAGRRPELERLLGEFQGSRTRLAALLGALLPPKVIPCLLAQGRVPMDAKMVTITLTQQAMLLDHLTRLPFTVQGVRGFEYCQGKAGGIPVEEVEASTLRSKRIPGLYLAGETLAITGPCGGYNLHLAFASGWLAGEAAIR